MKLRRLCLLLPLVIPPHDIVEDELFGDAESNVSDALVGESLLHSEIQALRSELQSVLTDYREGISADIKHYIDALESRVTENVSKLVAADFNRVAIRCITNETALKSELSKLASSLNSLSLAHDEMRGQIAQQTPGQSLAFLEQALVDVRSEVDLLAQESRLISPLSADLNQVNQDLCGVSARLRIIEDRMGFRDTASRPPLSPRPSAVLRADAQDRNRVPPFTSQADAGPIGKQATDGRPPPASSRPFENVGPRFPSPPQRRLPRSRDGDDHSGGSSYISDFPVTVERVKSKLKAAIELVMVIVKTDLSNVSTKSAVLELKNYELQRLQERKKVFKQLETQLDKLGVSDPDLESRIDLAQGMIVSWEDSLLDLKKRFYMHLQPNTNLLKKVELPPSLDRLMKIRSTSFSRLFIA